MRTPLSTRNESIDLLRFIGIAMIILAHVSPPEALFQIRNFDVPLMVVVAGLSFRLSFRGEDYGQYLLKRVKRLVLPVWLFLTASFLLDFLVGHPGAVPSLQTVLLNYSLLDGAGYVWIIRVFLMVAMLAPFILSYSKSEPSHARFFALVAGIYLAYELTFLFYSPPKRFDQSQVLTSTVNSTLLYLIPYAAIFALGLRIPDLNKRQIAILAASAGMVFVAWVFFYENTSGTFIYTQGFKYPPRSYYLSYALLVTTLLWLAAPRITAFLSNQQPRAMAVILFIGQNSIWVYLWHEPFIQNISLPYLTKYLVVFSLAVLVTYLQVTLVSRYLLAKIHRQKTKTNLRLILTG